MAGRRRLDDWLPSADEMSGVGAGTPEIANDQSGGSDVVAAPPVPAGGPGIAPEPMPEGEVLPPVSGAQPGAVAQGLNADLGPDDDMADDLGSTSAMSDVDLAQMAEEDETAEQAAAIEADPTLSPEERAQLQRELAMTARRRLAGI